MNLEPRMVELSRDNFNSAIESFLRATDVIKDSETPCKMEYYLGDKSDAVARIKIHFTQKPALAGAHLQEVKAAVDQTVH